MLLRCESLEPPMSQLGRCRLNVRITPRSGHVADIPDRQVRARRRRSVYSITSSARCWGYKGTSRPIGLLDQGQVSFIASSVGQRDPSWASNGNGAQRRTQAATILSRSARRWRDPSRTAVTISGGEVKGVPPGNGGAGSYSIES
jgi:hypothetical protein